MLGLALHLTRPLGRARHLGLCFASPDPSAITDAWVGALPRHLGWHSASLDPLVVPNAWVGTPSRSTAAHDLTPTRSAHETSINSPFMTSQKSQKGSVASVGFINLGSPMDPLPYKKLNPVDGIANNACLSGWPRYIMTGQGNDPVPDRKDWPRWGHSPTPTSFFDQGYVGPPLMILPRPT